MKPRGWGFGSAPGFPLLTAMVLTETISPGAAGDLILGADGLLAASLPSYEPRQAQVNMANVVGQTIEEGAAGGDGVHAMIEAGTGTGKSFAYLIPAILSEKRVVVSTDTIQLQQQLVDKDLPFLARVLEPYLGRPVTFAMAKGRGNYLCERNAAAYTKEYAHVDGMGAALGADLVNSFRRGDWDGDKATLKLPVTDAKWSLYSGDDSCTGRSCANARECPYLKAKEQIENADVVVTNHTMYLLHHYVMDRTDDTRGILPEHTVWIADEAHTLTDKVVDVFGVEIKHHRPGSFLKRVLHQAKALRLDLGDIDAKGYNAAADAFFKCFHGAVKDQQRLSDFPPEVVADAKIRMEHLVSCIRPVRKALDAAAADVDPQDKETRGAIARLYDNAAELIWNLESIFEEADAEFVVYAEVSGNQFGSRDVTLHRKPVETRPICERILGRLQTAVYTSATLATGYGLRAFTTALDELGLTQDAHQLQVESPFDYAKQCIGYIPASLPESRDPEYHTAIARELVTILTYTQGRAFVLFTSIRDMKRVYELVASQVRFNLLLQGEKPKDLLVEEFRGTPNSVLFGVKTFWTGVDIPGDALTCVILVKLPFPQPEHPLVKARCERIEARGGSGFRDFMLPRCIRDVKQGFGRLIRSTSDEGIFVLLDPRMRTAKYGRKIADALPSFPCVTSL